MSTIGRPPAPLAERFWALVAVGDGCWEWMGHRNNLRGGYGVFQDSRKSTGQRFYRAHRLAYELHYGPFDPELLVLHLCDNPPCVNPGHLMLGTQKENLAQMFERGRQSNRTKQECSRGHAYAEYGRVYPNGRKVCLVCQRDADLTNWYRRQGRERPPTSMSREEHRARKAAT